MSINDYSTDPGENIQVSGIDIAEGCAPGGVNNAIRQIMADLAASGAKNPELLRSSDQPNAIFIGTDGRLYVPYGSSVMTDPQALRSGDAGNLIEIGTDDGLYVSPDIGETIPWDGVTDKPESYTPSAHAATHLPGGADPLTFSPIPSGIIMLWKGSAAAIPTGWALCNGSNGTPDLRDRFVLGAGGSYAAGTTGGSATATTSGTTQTPQDISNAPRHGHSFPCAFDVSKSGGSGSTICAHIGYAVPGPAIVAIGTTQAGSGTTSHTHAFNATVATIPPFYALCYIMKL